jgi:hypothetical protein
MKRIKSFLSVLTLLWLAAGILTCSEPEKPKPSITSIDPAQGQIGTAVSIIGENLSSSVSVSFGGTDAPIAFKSGTLLETAVPASLPPGELSIVVKADHASSNSLSFKVLPSEPEITSIEPDKASTGMEVTLKGKHLNTASSVTFGTKSTSTFISKSDTEIKLVVPDGLDPGALDVTVTTDGGISNKATFTVVGKPTITSFTPTIGPVGRTVLITGTFFELATMVKFGAGEQPLFEIKNATLIETTVPATATTGKVTVVTPGGEAVSTVDFVVKDAPKITSFTPTSGAVGTVVTIIGESFDAGGLAVKFGNGTASTPTLVSLTQITATVPASATTGKITVETAAGSVQSTGNFTVIGSPAVTSFTPTSGGIGTEVTITGSNFISVTNVKFNTTLVSPSDYSVISSTQIKAKVPAGAVTGKITVETQAGNGSSANNFTVLVPPTITSFSPVSGAQGSNVVITGTGFFAPATVSFNGVNAPAFTIISPTQINVTVPSNATSGKITVTNSVGSATSTATFYVTPFISAINPTSGNPGTTITLTGTNLNNSTVRFNSTNVTPVTNSNTTITAVVPAMAPGAVNVSVVNPGGTSNSRTFTVTSPVVLDEIVASANIAGQLILLKGSNLLGASKVTFGAVQANVLTNTSTVVTALIPASLPVGNYTVRVETSNGISNGKPFDCLSVQNPNTGGVTLVNGSVVTPPGNFVPPVSNQWSNNAASSEKFFLEETTFNSPTGTLSVEYSIDFNTVASGTGYYDKPNNYIEFTLAGVRYVGIWTPRNAFNDGFDDYCVYHLTLISAESGKQLELNVNVFGPCE